MHWFNLIAFSFIGVSMRQVTQIKEIRSEKLKNLLVDVFLGVVMSLIICGFIIKNNETILLGFASFFGYLGKERSMKILNVISFLK